MTFCCFRHRLVLNQKPYSATLKTPKVDFKVSFSYYNRTKLSYYENISVIEVFYETLQSIASANSNDQYSARVLDSSVFSRFWAFHRKI